MCQQHQWAGWGGGDPEVLKRSPRQHPPYGSCKNGLPLSKPVSANPRLPALSTSRRPPTRPSLSPSWRRSSGATSCFGTTGGSKPSARPPFPGGSAYLVAPLSHYYPFYPFYFSVNNLFRCPRPQRTFIPKFHAWFEGGGGLRPPRLGHSEQSLC